MKASKKNKGLNGSSELFDQARSTRPMLRTIGIYLCICLAAVITLIYIFNALIKKHDEQLTNEICNLVTEKMNSSIAYMTSSARNMSAVLSAQDCELDELYSQVSKSHEGSYESVGFIDNMGKIYASETELAEFKKWDLVTVANDADRFAHISISSPYRSGLTGELVFTIFTHMTYGGGKNGKLFVTYPLKEIQNMAATDTLKSQTEIWLMDAASSNIIQCAGSNKYSIGSWNNALIKKQEIDSKYQNAYSDWKSKMDLGEEQGTLVYRVDGQLYTQVFSKADFMHGWYVVVRLPSSSLSQTLMQFRYSVLVFSAVLTLATLIMFIVSHRRQVQEKLILENLSIHDPLTGVMNRRAFDLSAEHTLSRISKNGAVLLFLDIDFFKEVNDRFGHEAGDTVLKGFAAELTSLFGDIGTISRYGGDEFLVLTSGISHDDTDAKLAELQQRISNMKITDSTDTGNFRLSFSAGGALYPRNARTLKELKACADEALYIVKKNGRNGWGWFDDGKSKDYSYKGKKPDAN